MKYDEYQYLIKSDLYRRTGDKRFVILIKNILMGGSYKYLFWLRTSSYSSSNKILKFTLYPVARIILSHYKYKFGINIPYRTSIGSGFYIGHFGCITINPKSVIGKNCNISPQVSLGKANRGKNIGYPTIGDNVYIGPGAKIVGGVKIGNNVAIGANCVVTIDIPDDSVVVGIPGKVISKNGSRSYINRTDYE